MADLWQLGCVGCGLRGHARVLRSGKRVYQESSKKHRLRIKVKVANGVAARSCGDSGTAVCRVADLEKLYQNQGGEVFSFQFSVFSRNADF